MRSWRRAVVLGVLVWLVPFAVAVSIMAIKDTWRSLFESLMAVTVAACVVAAALVYLRGAQQYSAREGLALGCLWLAISVGIDLPLMLSPPINYSLSEYVADIGVTYLMMPIITTGMASMRR